ncbi:hypothetical protein WNZ15_15575 [Roseibium sp. AS2]|uniref:hypothetical protein n=1 Tax=Roseibium sp. AS2 TaxID=3135781 RepID=UPI00317D472C
MMTFRKRILAASTPVILGTAFMASALGAVDIMSDDAVDATAGSKRVIAMAEATATTGKGDLKVKLSDVKERPVRCVASFQKTSCTGWPVAPDLVAY